MLAAAQEAVIREVWNIRKLEGAAGRKRQQGKGADEQIQEKVWDPRGPQQQSRGSHEKELMIILAVEYDAGASSTSPRGRTTQHHSTCERISQHLSNLKRNLQAGVFCRSIFEQMGEEERRVVI
jgi:hypothetical protein